jgi:Spy/CpxP family protein refolding chaperone
MLRHSMFGGGLGVLLFVSAAFAQPGGFPGGPPGGQPGGFPGGPPGGFFPGPIEITQPGQVLPTSVQEQLKLTEKQKKQLVELQKEVDGKLAALLTPEQQKALQDLKNGPTVMRIGTGGTIAFGPPGAFGPGGFGPGGFGPGGFGAFGPVRLDDVKKQVSATDEEWKVLSPKLQKVINARQVLNGEAGGGSPGGFGGPPTGNLISQAQDELKTVLNDPKHTKAEVEEKIKAVRKARQKAKEDLEAAQKDLLQMVTPAQEAVLISLGYLE